MSTFTRKFVFFQNRDFINKFFVEFFSISDPIIAL
jgi:hypothetical protein